MFPSKHELIQAAQNVKYLASKKAMTSKTMIMAAPNGARRTKADHPRLPVTASEVATEACLCARAGAAAVHAHVRDHRGRHSLDTALYERLISAINTSCPDRLVIQITTEAVGQYTPADQIACVKAVKPRAVSVALREIAPSKEAEKQAGSFFSWMRKSGISAQIILYSPQEVERFVQMQQDGIGGFSRPFLLFVLGRYADEQQAVPSDLDPFVDALGNHNANWAVCAFGRNEAACAVHAASLGGHVRIGFENNIHMPDGTLAASNADMVEAVAAKLDARGHSLMSCTEAHDIFDAATH